MVKVNVLLALLSASASSAFTINAPPTFLHQHRQHKSLPSTFLSSKTTTVLCAGGFEWEDPTENLDPGVENPFKNPELLEKIGEDGEGMTIDPARLLGPRLQGSNLYFVGMMGSGKSAVGDAVARSKLKYLIASLDQSISADKYWNVLLVFACGEITTNAC